MGNNNTKSPGIEEMMRREGGLDAMTHSLLGVGGGINAYDNDGLTPLHRAILEGSVTGVKHLIKLGADPRVKTKGSWSTFHIAAKTGNMEIMAVLLGHGVSVDEPSKEKIEMTEKNRSSKGIENNKIVFVGGSTALHVASQMGNTKVAHLLVSIGPRSEKVRNDAGLTPEQVAVYSHHSEVVRMLHNDISELRVDFERHRQEVDTRFRELEHRLSVVEERGAGSMSRGCLMDRDLTDAEKKMIKANFNSLSKKINVKQLICLLYDRCVLSCDDMESLRSLQADEDMQKRFIINNKLVAGKVKDIVQVKKVFEESGHGNLAKCLPNVN